MKIAVLVIPLVILVAGAAILATKDTSVEVFPAEAAETKAMESLEAADSDPDQWTVDSVCLNMGSCSVSVSAKAMPEAVLAINRYTVKDSKPTLNGSDRIMDVAARAERQNCFATAAKPAEQRECISRLP